MHSITFGISKSKGKAGATSEAVASAGEAGGHQWREVNLEVTLPSVVVCPEL